MTSRHGVHRFTADPVLLRQFPGMALVVGVVHGIDNRAASADLDRAWVQAWQEAAALGLPNAQSHPHVAHLRECFRGLGISHKKYPTSLEAMLRRALKGGEPFRINPLVDLYNALSLRHMSPAGAFDLAGLDADLELRFTRSGDTFTALDDDARVDVAAGETAYASGATILTRHFMWRQSREALVQPETRDVFFVSEIPGVAPEGTAERMREDFMTAVRSYFSVEAVTDVLDETRVEFHW